MSKNWERKWYSDKLIYRDNYRLKLEFALWTDVGLCQKCNSSESHAGVCRECVESWKTFVRSSYFWAWLIRTMINFEIMLSWLCFRKWWLIAIQNIPVTLQWHCICVVWEVTWGQWRKVWNGIAENGGEGDLESADWQRKSNVSDLLYTYILLLADEAFIRIYLNN